MALNLVSGNLASPILKALGALASAGIDAKTKTLHAPAPGAQAVIDKIGGFMLGKAGEKARDLVKGSSKPSATAFCESQRAALGQAWTDANVHWSDGMSGILGTFWASPNGVAAARQLRDAMHTVKGMARGEQFATSLAEWSRLIAQNDRSSSLPEGTLVVTVDQLMGNVAGTPILGVELEGVGERVAKRMPQIPGMNLGLLLKQPAFSIRVVTTRGETMIEFPAGSKSTPRVRTGHGFTFLSVRGKYVYARGNAPDVVEVARIFMSRELMTATTPVSTS